jgi:predicted HicB family RNase H-like nuclease
MKNMMEYKGYLGSVSYSDEDSTFYGKVEFIRSLISFEGDEVESLRQSFHEAVDDYLESCKKKGIKPEKPFKGTFNVRTGSSLHRRAVLKAEEQGLNLNTFVATALENYIDHLDSGSTL